MPLSTSRSTARQTRGVATGAWNGLPTGPLLMPRSDHFFDGHVVLSGFCPDELEVISRAEILHPVIGRHACRAREAVAAKFCSKFLGFLANFRLRFGLVASRVP